MAEKKVNKRTKKINDNFVIEEVKELKPLTTEERLLGVKAPERIITKIDYRNPQRFYNVFVCSNNRTITVNGIELGAFLGLQYEAKKELENGAKFVELKNRDGKLEYKIEVL